MTAQPLAADSLSNLPTEQLHTLSPALPDDPTDLLIQHVNDFAVALAQMQAQAQRIYAMDLGIAQPQMIAVAKDHLAAMLSNVAQAAAHAAKLGPLLAAMAALEQVQPFIPQLVSNAPKEPVKKQDASFLMDQGAASGVHVADDPHEAT